MNVKKCCIRYKRGGQVSLIKKTRILRERLKIIFGSPAEDGLLTGPAEMDRFLVNLFDVGGGLHHAL